jgi:hypothetical protein
MVKLLVFVFFWFLLDLGLCTGFVRYGGVSPWTAALGFAGIQWILMEALLIRPLRGFFTDRIPDLNPKNTRAWIALGIALPFGWVLLGFAVLLRSGLPRLLPAWGRLRGFKTLGAASILIFLGTEWSPVQHWAWNPMTVTSIQDREFEARLNQWESALQADPNSYLTVEQRWAFYDQVPIRSAVSLVSVRDVEEEFLQGIPELSREESGLQILEMTFRLWEKYLVDSRGPRFGNPLVLSGMGGLWLALDTWLNQEMEDITRDRLRTVALEQIQQLESTEGVGGTSQLVALRDGVDQVLSSSRR